MTLAELLILLIVAGVCGSVGQAIVGYSSSGCVVSVVVGLIGATIGMWLKTAANLPEMLPLRIGGQSFPIVWSVIGAALFVGVLGALTRRRV